MKKEVKLLLSLHLLDAKLQDSKSDPTRAQSRKREGLLRSLPVFVVEAYERLWANDKTPIAVCDDGYCEACHMRVPPYIAERVERGNEIYLCDNCGRILYSAPKRSLARPAA